MRRFVAVLALLAGSLAGCFGGKNVNERCDDLAEYQASRDVSGLKVPEGLAAGRVGATALPGDAVLRRQLADVHLAPPPTAATWRPLELALTTAATLTVADARLLFASASLAAVSVASIVEVAERVPRRSSSRRSVTPAATVPKLHVTVPAVSEQVP